MKLLILPILAISLLGGCATLTPNQNIIAWSQSCSIVNTKRINLEGQAQAGDFTALQKSELLSLGRQALKLCSVPPTAKNRQEVDNALANIITQYATFTEINKGISTLGGKKP